LHVGDTQRLRLGYDGINRIILVSYRVGISRFVGLGDAMSMFRILTLILVLIAFYSEALAFEFSNRECEFKVNFPFRPSVKKVVQPLGNGMYSNTYMVQAVDNRTGRVFIAQCDTSFRLVQGITMSQKRKMAEWSVSTWAKMINLKNTQMFWEEQGNYSTLRMVGQRVLVEAGKRLRLAFQAREYLGRQSTMLVGVGEPASLSPSAEMEKFLNLSVQLN
jgi:hypothetical protein